MAREETQIQQSQKMVNLRAKLSYQIATDCLPFPILGDQLPQQRVRMLTCSHQKKHHADAVADNWLRQFHQKKIWK